jgi:hypothetical protein
MQWLFHAIFGKPQSTAPAATSKPAKPSKGKRTKSQKHCIIADTSKTMKKLIKRYKKILLREKRLKRKTHKIAKTNAIALKPTQVSKPNRTAAIPLDVETREPISKDLRQIQSLNEKLRILQFTAKVQERMQTTGESYPEAWHMVHNQYTSAQELKPDSGKGSSAQENPVIPVQRDH